MGTCGIAGKQGISFLGPNGECNIQDASSPLHVCPASCYSSSLDGFWPESLSELTRFHVHPALFLTNLLSRISQMSFQKYLNTWCPFWTSLQALRCPSGLSLLDAHIQASRTSQCVWNTSLALHLRNPFSPFKNQLQYQPSHILGSPPYPSEPSQKYRNQKGLISRWWKNGATNRGTVRQSRG